MLDYLIANPTLAYVYIGVISLLVGSFLNVVIHRLPMMMEREWRQQCEDYLTPADEAGTVTEVTDTTDSNNETYNLVVPRSACAHCGYQLSALDNIPVLSYLFLKGKCRQCKTPISIQYPLVELITAILSLVTVSVLGLNMAGLAAVGLTWALVALSVIDLKTQLLPDSITLPLMWIGLILNSVDVFTDLPTALFGAVFGYLSLWSVYWVFKLVTGKEGMGYGDFKLLAALGAWIGWTMLPVIILLSSVVGAIIGITMIVVRGHDRQIPIPFGPYLAIAGWIALLWGDSLTQGYAQFLQ